MNMECKRCQALEEHIREMREQYVWPAYVTNAEFEQGFRFGNAERKELREMFEDATERRLKLIGAER
jgi:hypothetical protein